MSESDGEVKMRELVRLLYGEYVGEKAQSEKRLQRWAEALLQSHRGSVMRPSIKDVTVWNLNCHRMYWVYMFTYLLERDE